MSPSVLVVKFQTAQAQFYRDLVAKNPKLEEFLAGWLRMKLMIEINPCTIYASRAGNLNLNIN